MEEKQVALQAIYSAFEQTAMSHKAGAACRKGCAYCCTDAGSIDITTLEGLAIRETIRTFTRPRQVELNKALARDMKRREKGQSSACPFLLKNKACMIYDIRPFSCRRIYSLESCHRDRPPIIHRHVMELGRKTIAGLQRLDHSGYSGHISYILHMLAAPKFLSTYLAGEFKPEEITVFGKTHRIVINQVIDKETPLPDK